MEALNYINFESITKLIFKYIEPNYVRITFQCFVEQTSYLILFVGRLAALHAELERSSDRENKVLEDNRQLNERISTLEKECASLELELKAAQNRYNQEVRAHEETEKSRLLTKEEANIEAVKGNIGSLVFV